LRVRFALLADYSNVTREGKINILGLFDFINARDFPAMHAEMQFVIRFEADISERGQQKEVEVRLINDRADTLMSLDGRITIADFQATQMPFINQVLILRNLVFPAAGDYQFDIYIDGQRAHGTPLRVVHRP
jgi:hypothetical protein